jgi:hypothetical protein
MQAPNAMKSPSHSGFHHKDCPVLMLGSPRLKSIVV